MPGAHALQLLHAVVGARIEGHDPHALLDLPDEGQEQRTIEAAGIKVLRRDVGGGHHHHAVGEQLLEQPAEDHGVGDVGDVEFVEAQHLGLVSQRLRHRGDGVGALALTLLLRLPLAEDALVHVAHEFVEMRPALALGRQRIKEEVHEHGLAAADLAIDIHALGLHRGAALEQPAERRGFLRQRPLPQFQLQSGEFLHHFGLGRIFRDFPSGKLRRIKLRDPRRRLTRHERVPVHPPFPAPSPAAPCIGACALPHPP